MCDLDRSNPLTSTLRQMDHILEECLKHKGQVLFLKIPELDDVAASLYVLNSGMSPLMPMGGDFAYDFAYKTFSIYFSNSWRHFTISDIESLVQHPNSNNIVV